MVLHAGSFPVEEMAENNQDRVRNISVRSAMRLYDFAVESVHSVTVEHLVLQYSVDVLEAQVKGVFFVNDVAGEGDDL